MKTEANTPSSSPTVIKLLIIIIPSALLLIVLLALPPSIAVLVWWQKKRGKINLNKNLTEQNMDAQVNEMPIAQVQRFDETESEELYSRIDNSTSQQNHNRPEAVHLPAAGDQSDAANGSQTIYDTIGSLMTQEGDVTEPTYNTLNFKTKPKIMRATESGSHLPLTSPERNLPQETGDDTYSVLGAGAVSRGTTAADEREKREVAAGVYSTIDKRYRTTLDLLFSTCVKCLLAKRCLFLCS